ncbi:hypothetical protein D3C73_1395270 [compost metagenome]
MEAGDALTQSLGGGQLFSLGLFQLGAASFEFLQGGVGSTTGLALGNQEVAGVTVTHADDFTQVAQIEDFFEQNNLHFSAPD